MPAGVVGELVVPAFLAPFLVIFAWAYSPWPPTDFRENHDRSTNGITVVEVRVIPEAEPRQEAKVRAGCRGSKHQFGYDPEAVNEGPTDSGWLETRPR